MKYVGIDLHKKTIVVCVMNKERKVLARGTLGCAEPEKIVAYFKALGRFEAVVEATSCYPWLFGLLEPLAVRLVLAHPGKLRVIAESVRKSDKVDAEALATFLALDMLPTAYCPTVRERAHRTLVRHRVSMQQQLTSVKCRIRHLLANHNIDHGANPLAVKNRAWFATVPVSSEERFVLDMLLAEFDFLKRHLKEADKRIFEFTKTAGPAEAEARELLRSIPGVGVVTAETVLAELADPARFGSIKKGVSYAGLAPGRRESAGKAHDLPITKQGSRLLRWVLIESAWQVVRYNENWKASFAELKRRRGAKRAIVAIARRLLGMMLTIVRTKTPYSVDHRNQALPAKTVAAPKPQRQVARRAVERTARRRQAAVKQAPVGKGALRGTTAAADFAF